MKTITILLRKPYVETCVPCIWRWLSESFHEAGAEQAGHMYRAHSRECIIPDTSKAGAPPWDSEGRYTV